MLRWLMTVVVSDEEKAHVMRQVGIGKASVSEPLMKRRNNQDDIRTGEFKSLRDEPGGCPLIGQAVSGVKAARAWSAASAGNVGRRVPIRACLCHQRHAGRENGEAPPNPSDQHNSGR